MKEDHHTPAPQQKKIRLMPIAEASQSQQRELLEVRNSTDVRRWMYTDHIISEEEHFQWIKRQREDRNRLNYLLLGGDEDPLGMIGAQRIDPLHKSADWAFYLAAAVRGGGFGVALEFFFIDFLFRDLCLKKLNCEVIEGNAAVVKLHKKFFFCEEGFRESQIIKEGERKGVHLLGLTKERWEQQKEELFSKYHSLFNGYLFRVMDRGTR